MVVGAATVEILGAGMGKVLVAKRGGLRVDVGAATVKDLVAMRGRIMVAVGAATVEILVAKRGEVLVVVGAEVLAIKEGAWIISQLQLIEMAKSDGTLVPKMDGIYVAVGIVTVENLGARMGEVWVVDGAKIFGDETAEIPIAKEKACKISHLQLIEMAKDSNQSNLYSFSLNQSIRPHRIAQAGMWGIGIYYLIRRYCNMIL